VKNLPNKTLILSVFLFATLLVIEVVLIIRLWPFLGRDKPQPSTPTSTPVRRVVTAEDIQTELRLLEEYHVDNNIAFPENYESLDIKAKRIALLQFGVLEREVTWRSGGYIFISSIAYPAQIQVSGDPKELARQKIDDYHTRAKAGEPIVDLIQAVNKDSVVEQLNRPLIVQALGEAPSVFKSSMFQLHTQGEDAVVSDEVANRAIFGLDEGEVSEVYSSKVGYLFIVVTKAHNGRFTTYDDWLSHVSSGKLTTSLVKLSRYKSREAIE